MDVISLSSESNDSDVEIIGSFSNVMTKGDPLPLTAVRVDVDAVNVNVPTLYIDLTNPRWTLPGLKNCKRQNSSVLTLVDLTETKIENGTNQETENLPPNYSQVKQAQTTNNNPTSNKQDLKSQKSSSRDPTDVALQQDCGNSKLKQRRLDSQTQHQKEKVKARLPAAIVKLRRLPFLDSHCAELKKSRCFVYLNKDGTQMSLHSSQPDSNSEAPQCISNLSRTTTANGPHMDHPLDESSPKVVESSVRQEEQENSNEFTNAQLNAKISPHLRSPPDSPFSDKEVSVATSKTHITCEEERDDFCLSTLRPSPTSPSSSQVEAQGSLHKEVICSKLEQLELDKAVVSDHSFSYSPTTGPNPSETFGLDSMSHQVNTTPTSEHTLAESTSKWQLEVVKAHEPSNNSEFFFFPSEPPLSTESMDDKSGAGTDGGELGVDSPVSFLWQEGSDGDEDNKESRFDIDFRAASREDRQFVCPVTLRKIMSGTAQALFDGEDDDFGTPEMLCRQSLSLVYSTIDENYPEGTLELLSDLLQPGYYPPRDITSHLLHGILLNPQCPYHLCVQAFNLLMRTQRLHVADKTTVPWDWELLTSIMLNQDPTKKHRCEVVRMLLDYVVKTLEDDFQAQRSISTLHHSIAKATLSCDQQFPHVRDVIKWLFSAIIKSTEHGESKEAARERDEQIRMVSIFQRMLFLALEVDRSPALNSAKLSQELFHMLISDIPLRAHRMLLLESLQSMLLR
ncbi:SUMO-interacting motif-containing protein 1 isoform X3 [Etheostoma cragini]|nr:SUMO-interacting motif-containing protein 1 isoform X3 [Etheostoma cragini]